MDDDIPVTDEQIKQAKTNIEEAAHRLEEHGVADLTEDDDGELHASLTEEFHDELVSTVSSLLSGKIVQSMMRHDDPDIDAEEVVIQAATHIRMEQEGIESEQIPDDIQEEALVVGVMLTDQTQQVIEEMLDDLETDIG